MNALEKRPLLRSLLLDCPACSPDDVDQMPDEELDAWIVSHSPEPRIAGPLERFDPCTLSGHRVCRLPQHHLGPCSPFLPPKP